jgi:universal stress protein E
MKLVRTILAAIDVRSQSEVVLQTVAMLAAKFGSQVTLVHVLPVEDATTSDLRALVELARGEATRCLERSAARLQQMGIVSSSIVVAEGNVAEQIVRLSDERDANVVILGCGNEIGAAPSLGRNAEAVTRLAEKPVWIVKTSEVAAPNSILCAVDYTASSRRALKNAVHLARVLGSELTVMRSVASPGFSLLPLARQETTLEESQRVAEEQRLADYLGEFDLHNVQWRPMICSGEPSAAILDTARTLNPQLVIAGTDYVAGWMQMLQGDSITYLARHLPCSLIVIKAEDAVRLEMDRQLADAQTHYERGCDLMTQGFSREAVEEFQHCVRGNAFFIPAWLGLADAYRRLGDLAKADDCEKSARELKDSFAWDRVTADVRRNHPLWRKSLARG